MKSICDFKKKSNHCFFFYRPHAADFGFARYLQSNMMAATLCGSPMYMVGLSVLYAYGPVSRQPYSDYC